MTRTLLAAFVAVLVSGVASAAEKVTTLDGRVILLKDDGTYEIIATESTSNSGYIKIDYDDLVVNKKELLGKKVTVKGYLYVNTISFEIEETVAMYRDRAPGHGFQALSIKELSVAERKKMLKKGLRRRFNPVQVYLTMPVGKYGTLQIDSIKYLPRD